MDPITHTLVGASLASSRLGGKTVLGATALIVGANLPDIDVLSYVAGSDAALGFRRGWTHGVLALVVLPAVLAVALYCVGRWRAVRAPRGRPSIAWLLALSYVAVLTHPMLDWLNTYGMRWLMPFRDTWFYGDSVFIVDPWLWLILGTGWLIGREPTRGLLILFSLFVAPLLLLTSAVAPAVSPLLLSVAAVLLMALLKRPDGERAVAARAAVAGLGTAVIYIVALLTLQARAEMTTRSLIERESGGFPEALMVGPVPADPLTWEVVATDAEEIRYGRFSWREGWRINAGRLELSEWSRPRAELSPAWPKIVGSGQSPGFLAWVRFPWLEIETHARGVSAHVMDGRYVRERTAGFGAAIFSLPAAED